MKVIATRFAAVAAVLLASAALAPPSQAQSWPQRQVRFIIPFGPGAGADIGARLIQDSLAKRWGQPVVIENRPGGDSIIAIQQMLSANDDHTFLWGPSGNFTVHPYLYRKLPYDPANIIPIARYSATILGVGVPAAMKFTNLADFVKRARAAPGKFNSAAVPGITDLALDYFFHSAKVTTTKVPYKDIVKAAVDVGEGRLQIYASSYAILRPHRERGSLVVLAQMGAKRAPSLPDLTTAAEQGFPALEMEGLVGLFGSKAVSAALRERIGADVVAVSTNKAVVDRLNATAQVPMPGGAKDFADHIARQRAHVANIVKALKIKPMR